MSVGGGFVRAVERARLHGCESLQIFAKNASQWRGRPIDADEAVRFREAVAESGLAPVVSHASYLINLASTAPALRAQSIAALIDELDRADALGLQGVVLHPGTCTAGTEDDALRLVADGIREALNARREPHARLLLEHTAGQGRTIGHRFEHLAAILGHIGTPAAVGVCLDTCHLHAAGYDLTNEAGYQATFLAFEQIVGFDRLAVIHANDSKKPLGSRVDRHEHIGEGTIGLEAFARLLRDPRLAGLPFLLETAKADTAANPRLVVSDPLDMKNLATLRRLRD
jgi:deoxyribonuclease-4